MKKILFVVAVIFSVVCMSDAYAQSLNIAADLVIVDKSERRMRLMQEGRILREYRVALGKNPLGHKQQRGDSRTPEGAYEIAWRNPNSNFYKALNISYPDAEDIALARQRGVSPGDLIMIHGITNGKTPEDVGHPEKDWTDGCIAVEDNEMDEIWQLVDDGTKIVILP